MIAKRVKQIYLLAVDCLLYCKMKFLQKPHLNEKVLYVNFHNPNLYHRYFYILIKNFQLAGYSVIFPMNFSKFRNLRNGDQYLGFIFKDIKTFSIKNLPKKSQYVELNETQFSPNYYFDFFENSNRESGHHIPMSFHPNMYLKKIWNKNVEEKTKINSLFCFGNFDSEAYQTLQKSKFELLSRTQLHEFFKERNDFISVKSKNHLDNLVLQTTSSSSIVFAEKSNYPIPLEEVRERISNFRYFLCCPGVFAPLCHNITESFSVGAVPVIQKNYANVLYPNLIDRKNAIIFHDIADLKKIIDDELFNISEEEFTIMSKNVLDYFQKYMAPKNLVKRIVTNIDQSKTIFLNASERSIRYFLK